MNKLEERNQAEGRASRSEIDSLLAELGYQPKPSPSRSTPADAETESKPSRVTSTAAQKSIPHREESHREESRRTASSPAPPRERLEVRDDIEVALPKEKKQTRKSARRLTRDKKSAAAPPASRAVLTATDEPGEPLLDIPLEVPRRQPRPKRAVPESKFVRLLRGALEENVNEMEILTALPAGEGTPILSRGQRTRKFIYFCLGILFFVCAVWGLFSIGHIAAGRIQNFASNESQREELEAFLTPIVVMDISPFASVDELSDDQIITAAIWDIIMHGDFDKYPQTMGVLTVPAVDVEFFAAKLFGSGLTLSHHTVGAGDLSFYFSEDIKSYNIPAAPSFFSYMPRILSMKKDGDDFILDVAYQLEAPQWQQLAGELETEKTMRFVVRADGEGFCICSAAHLGTEE